MARLIKHYLPLLIIVFAAVIIFYLKWPKRDVITFVAQITGYISIIILTVSLIIGPINILLKHNNPVTTYFRRDISIIGGSLAIIHSITGLFVHLRGKTWLYFLKETDHGHALRLDNFGIANYTGLIAALIILLLLVTSNDYTLKSLKPKNWKNIQRLSYFMFVISLIHCYFYRIGKDDINIFYWLYMPLLFIVVAFQITGISLRLKIHKLQ